MNHAEIKLKNVEGRLILQAVGTEEELYQLSFLDAFKNKKREVV